MLRTTAHASNPTELQNLILSFTINMSSRFVSAGTDQNPIERDDDWVKAQQEVEARRKAKQDEANRNQNEGKSLYEVLQANKAAKQDAFEESIRLKNQFRALDDDEVDFLDSVHESSRAKEAAQKAETAEQLEVFRRQREAVEQARLAETAGDALKSESTSTSESWTIKKKRRREIHPDNTGGMKLRKLSASDLASPKSPEQKPAVDNKITKSPKNQHPPVQGSVKVAQESSSPSASGLGLDAYSSEED